MSTMKCHPTFGRIKKETLIESKILNIFSLQGTNETDGRACTKICRTLSVEELRERLEIVGCKLYPD